MKNLQDIIVRIQENKEDIKRLGIKRVGIYGSIVRGEAEASSDIDLIIDFDPKQKTYRNFLASNQLLERLLKREVDIVTPQALSPFIKPYIEREVRYVQIS